MRCLVLALLVAAFSTGALLMVDPALAAHVQCGDVIVQDTTLDSDLIDCPNHGIVIGADNITLDLNGHTIDGRVESLKQETSFDPEIDGVNNRDSHDGITLKNGSIKQFFFGVKLAGSGLATEDIVLHSLTISSVTALNGFPVERFVLDDLAITSGSFSMHVGGSHAASITRVVATSPHPIGALAILAAFNAGVVERNSFTNGGIFFTGSENVLRDNSASSSSDAGIVVHGERNLVENNLLVGHTAGIGVVGSSNVITKNDVVGALRDGIRVGDEFSMLSPNNVITRNRVVGSALDGVWVRERGPGTLIARNVTSRNGDDGIDLDRAGSGTTVTRNKANNNGDFGITASSTAVDGGRNKARGNGNPLQCLNVFCK
jgi:large repetitive protein